MSGRRALLAQLHRVSNALRSTSTPHRVHLYAALVLAPLLSGNPYGENAAGQKNGRGRFRFRNHEIERAPLRGGSGALAEPCSADPTHLLHLRVRLAISSPSSVVAVTVMLPFEFFFPLLFEFLSLLPFELSPGASDPAQFSTS